MFVCINVFVNHYNMHFCVFRILHGREGQNGLIIDNSLYTYIKILNEKKYS